MKWYVIISLRDAPQFDSTSHARPLVLSLFLVSSWPVCPYSIHIRIYNPPLNFTSLYVCVCACSFNRKQPDKLSCVLFEFFNKYIYIYIYTRTCSCIFAQVHARVHARTPPEQNKNAQVFLKLKHVRRKKKRRRRSDRKRKKRSRLTLTEIYKHSHSKKKKKKKKKYLGALKDATSTFHIHAEWGRLKIDV